MNGDITRIKVHICHLWFHAAVRARFTRVKLALYQLLTRLRQAWRKSCFNIKIILTSKSPQPSYIELVITCVLLLVVDNELGICKFLFEKLHLLRQGVTQPLWAAGAIGRASLIVIILRYEKDCERSRWHKRQRLV